ncbi:MAG: hypothetical protein WCO55_03355 [Candidatus Falkowbacteria bacterium]
MGLLGQIMGTQKFKRMAAKASGKYTPSDFHSHYELKAGLMKLRPDERQRVIAALQTRRLWGNAVSSQSVLEAVRDIEGEAAAKKVQRLVLTRYKDNILNPDQVRRNINLVRYERGKEEPGRKGIEQPHYVNEPWLDHSVGINSPKSGAKTTNNDRFANKRPISF